jgi:hypothetical protein
MDRVELSMARVKLTGGRWWPEKLARTSQASQPLGFLEQPS